MSTETALTEGQTKAPSRKKEITDISSMLLRLQDRNLLLPGVSVAEIVTFVPPEQNTNQEQNEDQEPVVVPPWYLGTIFWRDQHVPLVVYETLIGSVQASISDRCRIAVMNTTGLNYQLNFFAILLQATPRLLRLTQEEIIGNDDRPLEAGEQMHVYVFGEEAVVPEIPFIEKAIISYLELS